MLTSKHISWIGALILVLFVLTTNAMAQKKGGENLSGPYEPVPDWPQPIHDDWSWGSTAGIWAETPDRIFVFQRGELPVQTGSLVAPGGIPKRRATEFASPEKARWEHTLMIFNGEGKLIDSWEQHNHLFVRPHRVLVSPYDPDRNVWLVDDGAHQIFKFTPDGKRILLTLGEHKVPGNDASHFNRPTDIAWLPNGDFYVSDGYVNTRVLKFSKEGKYLMEWGKPGTGPGEFNLVHGIALDADQERIYVVDRANHRIQIFDLNGKYLDEWTDIHSAYFIHLTNDRHLWASDGHTQKFLKYDLEGKLLYTWGSFGVAPGELWGPHQFSVDSDGNLYVAEVHGGRPQKFRPKQGANPAEIVGQRIVP